MHYIDGQGHKSELRSSRNDLTNLNHATSYLWPQGWTHTHTRAHPHERDFKNQTHAAGWFEK